MTLINKLKNAWCAIKLTWGIDVRNTPVIFNEYTAYLKPSSIKNCIFINCSTHISNGHLEANILRSFNTCLTIVRE